ncbi:MAG TPA: ABC transporter permease [Polyangiaceae bacterium]|nr:ABC transporter permease [Polyangiaceae bacterium]
MDSLPQGAPALEQVEAPSLVPESASGAAAAGTLSHRQRIGLRLSKHRLAVASLCALFVLCALAAFSEPLAPYAPDARHLDYPYAPPQSLHFDPQRGLYTYALQRHVDPISFRKQYVELANEPLKLRFFAPGEPYELWGLIPMNRRLLSVEQRELSAGAAPSSFFLLGTDRYGRDVLSRAIQGARVSLSVAGIGVLFSAVLGLCLGALAGYVGGRTDRFIQRAMELVNAFPQLPLWIALSALLPADWPALSICVALSLLLGVLSWTGVARVVRGKILALRQEEYVLAARLMGASRSRVLFRHLLPGVSGELLVALTLAVPAVLLGETALSLLGLGLRPPLVSWGVMLQDCMDVKALRSHPWLLSPALLIIGTVLSFHLLGDGLREAVDPCGSNAR